MELEINNKYFLRKTPPEETDINTEESIARIFGIADNRIESMEDFLL